MSDPYPPHTTLMAEVRKDAKALEQKTHQHNNNHKKSKVLSLLPKLGEADPGDFEEVVWISKKKKKKKKKPEA